MEQRRDEQIHCADCGASFVFSANEAAVFADRGLSPPKRCKDCRRARKDRVAGDGAARYGHGRDGALRQAAPRRYTGDVNEYRSPMADGFFASPYGMPAGGSRGGQRQGSGEYRSPMANGNVRPGPDQGNRAPRFRPSSPQERGARPRGDDRRSARAQTSTAPTGQQAGANPGAEKAPRKRRPAELFSITCTTCGAQADVPFKPAEGREVYCPTCYRARRPAS